MRFPGGMVGAGGGLGLVGLVIVGLIKLLGGNIQTADTEGQDPSLTPNGNSGAALPPISGSCANVNSVNDPAKFAVCVETNVQAFWARELPRQQAEYQPAKLVLFSSATSSGCGMASASTGPFYCPLDERVYLDLGFFDELQRRFHAKGGDFAEAYVIAHEYGHHVQKLTGVEQRVLAAQRNRPSERNALSVRLELQADCLAGVWGHSAYAAGKVDTGEIAQALDAAAAVGDDRIQQQTTGRIRPERFTHGSAAERTQAFRLGMDSGDARKCEI
jgi:predicted metalloprotease